MTIRLFESLRALFYAPFYAALEIGAYDKEGVNVEFHAANHPQMSIDALCAGEAELIWGGPLRVLLQQEMGRTPHLVSFASVVVRDPFFVVGRKMAAVPSLSSLTRVQLGVVSEVPTPWICLQQDLKLIGIDPSSLDVVSGQTMKENVASFRRGEIQAVQIFEPYVEELLMEGASIWYSGAERGETAFSSFTTRRDLVELRREEFEAMARAMAKTLHWLSRSPADEVASVIAPYFPDVPSNIAARAIERYRSLGIWARDLAWKSDALERLKSSMVGAGMLSANKNFDCVVDNSLVMPSDDCRDTHKEIG